MSTLRIPEPWHRISELISAKVQGIRVTQLRGRKEARLRVKEDNRTRSLSYLTHILGLGQIPGRGERVGGSCPELIYS